MDYQMETNNNALSQEYEEQLQLANETKKFFGHFWKYLESPDVRNLDLDSNELWASYSDGTRRRIETDGEITPEFIDAFSTRARNSVSGEFSQAVPKLETEFDSYRITMVHEVSSVNGRTINIRKVSKYPVLNTESLIETKYVSKEVLNFIINCIRARCSAVVSGIPDIGKTEFLKYMSTFIPPDEKVITVESRREWFFKEFMPENDCISLITSNKLNEIDAIRLALCLNPKWLMFQECRGIETNEVLTGWTTGVPGITSIHTEDARKIPYRLVEMMGKGTNADYRINEVFEFLDVGIQLKWKRMPDGTRKRKVDQVAVYTNDRNRNNTSLIVDRGRLISNTIPSDLQIKFNNAGIENPFKCDLLEEKYWPIELDLEFKKEDL